MYKLDSIITVTDAKYILQRLDEHRAAGADNEAIQQVVFANKIILNKTDLVNATDLVAIEGRLRSMNPDAPILRCEHSNISPKDLLNIGAFDLEKVLKLDPFFLGEFKQPKHDKAIGSLSCKVEGEVNLQLLSNWINRLLHDDGEALYRYKGIIAVKGMNEKYIFQGVGHHFAGHFSKDTWGINEQRGSTFVFIGKNLDLSLLKAGFEACRQTELRFAVGATGKTSV